MFDIKNFLKENNLEYNPEITILDKINYEKSLLEIVLSDNTIIFGYPDCVIQEEDNEDDDNSPEHDELVFRIYKEGYGVFLREEEVKSFRKVDKDYVEAILASQESAE